MGFWDSVKKAATSAKCMTGFHAGEYQPIAGKPECEMENTCPDCHTHLTKTEHKYSNWEYIKDNQCDSKRNCIHCMIEESMVRHQSWNREKSNQNCQIHKECERCNTRELGATEHGPWFAGVAHGDGTQTFTCGGCGKNERRAFDPSAR
jgi:hypothetical protein